MMEYCKVICPACQNVSAAHASDRQATLHGVVFDILGRRAAPAMRLACRVAGEMAGV
jgi:hypothetical protein